MKTLTDISGFLRNELSQYAFNYDDLDASLGFAAGTIVRILDEEGDYSVMELMALLDRFGCEIAIFDKKVLQQLIVGPNGPAPELKVKTGVQRARDKLRE
jgi:serine/threonine-protein kinase HipA